MDVLPSPELSSDIQRALQQAVGQANNAFTSHNLTNPPKTTKRKRSKDDVGGEAIKQKKRKVGAEAAHASPRKSSSISAGAQLKKGRKASSKAKTQLVPDPGDTNESPVFSSPSESQSPKSFLDAVVSAASATSTHLESPYSLSQSCFDPQSLSSSCPYSATSNDPSLNAGAFQPPDSFSSTTVPGLDYASNNDILRVLQDFDVTKIATVLKTLGEAAAAANVPLTSLPSTLLQRPYLATPIDSTLSNSTAIAESSAPRVLQHQRRLVDTNIRQVSLERSDHAVLLATKWLSATRLAELAKTQGQCYAMSRFA